MHKNRKSFSLALKQRLGGNSEINGLLIIIISMLHLCNIHLTINALFHRVNDGVLWGSIFESVYDILHYEYFMWQWNDQHVTSMGQRKNLSPNRIRTYDLLNPQTSRGCSIHFSFGELMETLIYKTKFEIFCRIST